MQQAHFNEERGCVQRKRRQAFITERAEAKSPAFSKTRFRIFSNNKDGCLAMMNLLYDKILHELSSNFSIFEKILNVKPNKSLI